MILLLRPCLIPSTYIYLMAVLPVSIIWAPIYPPHPVRSARYYLPGQSAVRVDSWRAKPRSVLMDQSGVSTSSFPSQPEPEPEPEPEPSIGALRHARFATGLDGAKRRRGRVLPAAGCCSLPLCRQK